MRDTIATPEGTRDLLFQSARALRAAENAVRGALEDQGYSEVVTPTIEFYDMFRQANPAHAQESMLKVIDRSGRICVVRPDNTTPVARPPVWTTRPCPFACTTASACSARCRAATATRPSSCRWGPS